METFKFTSKPVSTTKKKSFFSSYSALELETCRLQSHRKKKLIEAGEKISLLSIDLADFLITHQFAKKNNSRAARPENKLFVVYFTIQLGISEEKRFAGDKSNRH